MTNIEASARNPLVLAFVGDAYWTLYIRKMLIQKSCAKVNKLHLEANDYVCASAQCRFFNKIAPFLTEAEQGVAGRARNAHQHTMTKSASLGEYKMATAFEAVVGYNVLVDNIKRLDNLFEIIMDGEG